MKNIYKFFSLFVLVSFLAIGLNAADETDFRTVLKENAVLLQKDDAKKEHCPVCGMNLPKFYKTNFASEVNGTIHQYCSVHCMFEEAMIEGIKITNPQVVDTNSLKFIDAKTAFFVYGSTKPATMASVSTYGFATEKAANEFADKFGGQVLNFDTLSEKVKANLEDDIKLIDKRQSMAAKKGEVIYNQRCQKIEGKFKTSGEAKTYLIKNKPCGKLEPMELSQVAHYLKKR